MERLTRFERARLISARALQLSLGAPPMVKVTNEISMYDLSKQELEQKLLPLAVLREYPNGELRKIELY